MRSAGDCGRPRRRVNFEKHASRVVFDPASSSFVVTWTSCLRPVGERAATCRNPERWVPSVFAVSMLFDRGCIRQEHNLFAAKAIGRAWELGDRYSLDTDDAKKSAKMVADLASIHSGESGMDVSMDIGLALRKLTDEIARARFSSVPQRQFCEDQVIRVLKASVEECLSVQGFAEWPAASQRRRMLYTLKGRHDRTDVIYSLIALMFGTGSCTILSASERTGLRDLAVRISGFHLGPGMDVESACSFFRVALAQMRSARESGTHIVHSCAYDASDPVFCNTKGEK